MDNNNFQIVQVEQEESDGFKFNFSDVVKKCRENWYWFLISVIVCLSAAFLYLLQSRTMFNTSATVLIKEASARRMATSDIESVLNFSGGTSMSSKVVNEVIAFKSPALMMRVVERLDLNTEYSVARLFRTDIVYSSQVPVEVKFLDFPGGTTASFNIAPKDSAHFSLNKVSYVRKGDKTKLPDIASAKFGDTLSTAFGHIVITRNKYFSDKWKKTVCVLRRPTMSTTALFLSRFKAEQEDVKNKSDVLNLSLVDPSPQRANDILNMMITIYNENWVEDKNKMAVSTSIFINDRLNSLENELGSVDGDISKFKSANLIPDVRNASENLYIQNRETDRYVQNVENFLYSYRYLRTYLLNNPTTESIIPMSANIESNAAATQIADYNKILLQRNSLRANSTNDNPVVIDLTSYLESLREAIVTMVENQVGALEKQLSELKKKEQTATSKMAQNPAQAQYLTTIGRQQKVKETLYLYLLQKREENELSQAFTAYNTRIITPPITNPVPSSPKKSKILLIALFLGIFIPLFAIYLIILTDNKIRSRKDIENLSIPFLGEVPQYVDKSSNGFLSLFKKKDEIMEPIVKEGARDVVNEAFRVLRTNIEFMSRGKECPVSIMTSFQPGSGKTFLSINTAATLAIKHKKVLIIDGDMRHASLSGYVNSPESGLSTYLSGQVDDAHSIIVKSDSYKTLDIIPSGSIPPNPSELLSSSLFADMVEKFKKEYDFIFIDCPPLDIVTDTDLIKDSADRTIFVARAGLFEKGMLTHLDKLSRENKFNNLSLILNGTNKSSNSYGAHRGYYGSANYCYGSNKN